MPDLSFFSYKELWIFQYICMRRLTASSHFSAVREMNVKYEVFGFLMYSCLQSSSSRLCYSLSWAFGNVLRTLSLPRQFPSVFAFLPLTVISSHSLALLLLLWLLQLAMAAARSLSTEDELHQGHILQSSEQVHFRGMDSPRISSILVALNK